MDRRTFDWTAWQKNLDAQVKAYERERAKAAQQAMIRMDQLNTRYSAQVTGLRADQDRILGEIDQSKRRLNQKNYLQTAATLDSDQLDGTGSGLSQVGTGTVQARKNASKGNSKLAVPTNTGSAGPAQSLSIGPSSKGKQ